MTTPHPESNLSMNTLLDTLFGPIGPFPDVNNTTEWRMTHLEGLEGVEQTTARALLGGFSAPLPSYAFASGFWEALDALVPFTEGTQSFCATESGGVHPRAIKTLLTKDGDNYRLSGCKTHCTLAPDAEHLIVIASRGTHGDGRNDLVALRIPSTRSGITLNPLGDLGFLPELSHAQIRLDNVDVQSNELMPGDGYVDYLKPFRTVEDIHVFAAVLGWVHRVARQSAWPPEWQEQLAGVLIGLVGLGACDPSNAGVHRTLGGIIEQALGMLEEAEPHWSSVEPTLRDVWLRDRKILQVAMGARAKRLEVARSASEK